MEHGETGGSGSTIITLPISTADNKTIGPFTIESQGQEFWALDPNSNTSPEHSPFLQTHGELQ